MSGTSPGFRARRPTVGRHGSHLRIEPGGQSMTESIHEEVRAIVADVAEMSVEEVSPDATLRELGIDSLGGLRIVAEVEKRYGIVVPEASIAKIRTMKDVLALVDAHSPKD